MIELLCFPCSLCLGCHQSMTWVAYTVIQSWCSTPQKCVPDCDAEFSKWFDEDADLDDIYGGDTCATLLSNACVGQCSWMGYLCCPVCVPCLYCLKGFGCCCCWGVCTGFCYPCCCCPTDRNPTERSDLWFAPWCEEDQ